MPKQDKRSPWQKIRDAANAGNSLSLTADEIDVVAADWGVQALAEKDDDEMRWKGEGYTPPKRQEPTETNQRPKRDSVPPRNFKPPTVRQLGAIAFIERSLGVKWRGESFEDAYEFIGEYFEDAKAQSRNTPPSAKQRTVIDIIEKNLEIKFRGKSSDDAYHFIKDNIDASKWTASERKSQPPPPEEPPEPCYDFSDDEIPF